MTPATATPAGPDSRRRRRRRLLAALALIALAAALQALFERHRTPHTVPPPPHEPSQALIAPPGEPAAIPDSEDNAVRTPRMHAQAMPVVPTGPAGDASYVVQAGVFASTANAQALQARLAESGLPARLETRVQLGPYRDRREAEAALARLRQLGLTAVIVDAR